MCEDLDKLLHSLNELNIEELLKSVDEVDFEEILKSQTEAEISDLSNSIDPEEATPEIPEMPHKE